MNRIFALICFTCVGLFLAYVFAVRYCPERLISDPPSRYMSEYQVRSNTIIGTGQVYFIFHGSIHTKIESNKFLP